MPCDKGQVLKCLAIYITLLGIIFGVATTGFFHLDSKITLLTNTLLSMFK